MRLSNSKYLQKKKKTETQYSVNVQLLQLLFVTISHQINLR